MNGINSIYRSSECERVGFCARLQQLDLDLPVVDAAGLADQLIQAFLDQHAAARFVDIAAMRGTGCLTRDHARS
jgi:hypothetical protein